MQLKRSSSHMCSCTLRILRLLYDAEFESWGCNILFLFLSVMPLLIFVCFMCVEMRFFLYFFTKISMLLLLWVCVFWSCNDFWRRLTEPFRLDLSLMCVFARLGFTLSGLFLTFRFDIMITFDALIFLVIYWIRSLLFLIAQNSPWKSS